MEFVLIVIIVVLTLVIVALLYGLSIYIDRLIKCEKRINEIQKAFQVHIERFEPFEPIKYQMDEHEYSLFVTMLDKGYQYIRKTDKCVYFLGDGRLDTIAYGCNVPDQDDDFDLYIQTQKEMLSCVRVKPGHMRYLEIAYLIFKSEIV